MEKLAVKPKPEVFTARTSLWLVRHGQTDWNLTGRWQGQSPLAPALNETGRRQARAVRAHLQRECISAIYSSDLLRSRQTAQLIAEDLHLPVGLEPRLREMNLGDWEGMLFEDIQAGYPRKLLERARDPWNTSAPGGESPAQVAERVNSAVNEIAARHRGETVLIVADGISLAVILCQARGFPLERLYEHIPANAELCQVEWGTPLYAGEWIRGNYSVV